MVVGEEEDKITSPADFKEGASIIMALLEGSAVATEEGEEEV